MRVQQGEINHLSGVDLVPHSSGTRYAGPELSSWT